MYRNAHHHLRSLTAEGPGYECESAEHNHVQDTTRVVPVVSGRGDPDVPDALDVLIAPKPPAELSYRLEVVVAEGADEDRRRVPLLHEPARKVERPRGQAVGRVGVVVDDPDPHGPEPPAPYLRVAIDSVTSAAPRTRSRRMGLSFRGAALWGS